MNFSSSFPYRNPVVGTTTSSYLPFRLFETTVGSPSVVPIITVDSKGNIRRIDSSSIQISESQVTNLVPDLASKVAKAGDTMTGPLIISSSLTVTGGVSVGNYIQLLPVQSVAIPTNQTASYIYTSGSTNDIYFTQYQPGTSFTNTTRLRWLEGSLSTGLLHGGTLSTVNGTTTFNVASGSGIIVNYNASTTADPYPTIKYIQWNNFVSQSLTYSGSAQITYVAIDEFGAISQLNSAFNVSQFKDRIVLGRVLHQTGSVTNGTISTPTTAYAVSSNTQDFFRSFGPLKVSGQVLAASGSTLSVTRTAGDSYVEGRNYSANPNVPNYVLATDDPALTVTKIYYEWVSGSTINIDTNGGVGYSAVRPAFYNLNGTVTAISPTNNKYTVQRVYWFPKSVTRALYIYYGSTIYTTLSDAVAAINNEPNFAEGDNTRASAVYVGAIVLEANTTDLTVTTKAQIVNGGLFRGAGGGGGGGGGSTGGGTPGGVNHAIQFNDAGTFNGSADFTYDTNVLTLNGNFNLVGTGSIDFDGGTLTGSLAKFGTMSGSVITGSTALYTTITGSTVTGSLALFTTISASSDITLAGRSVVITTDSRLSDARTPTGPAGGDLAGTYPNPTLAEITRVATSGSAARVPVVTIDTKGRVTGLSETAISITTSSVSGLGTAAGLSFDTDTTLAANSDSRIATQRATKTYADTKVAKAGDTMTGNLVITGAKLGINTSSPQYSIHSRDAAETWLYGGVGFSPALSTDAATPHIFFGNGGAGFRVQGSASGSSYPTAQLDLSSSQDIVFSNGTGLVAPTERMRLNSAGQLRVLGSGGPTVTSTAVLVVRETTYPYIHFLNNTGGGTGTDGFLVGIENNYANVYVAEAWDLRFATSGSERMRVGSGGGVSIGGFAPTAILHLKAGTATANTAPLKFAKGTNLTAPEDGAVEFAGDNLYLTITSSTARKNITLDEGLSFGQIPYTTIGGRLAGTSSLVYTASTSTLAMSFNQSARTAMTVTNASPNASAEAGFTATSDAGSFFFGCAANASANAGGEIYGGTAVPFRIFTNATARITIRGTDGEVGIGVGGPSAALHIKAGTATAGTAPLKFTSGTLMGTGEAGAVEFLTDKYYATITTGGSRKEIALNDGAINSGLVAYTTTNGRLTGSARLSYDGTSLRQLAGTYTLTPSSSAQAAIIVSGSGTVGGASYVDFIKVTNTSASATNINKTMRVDGAGALQVVNSAYDKTILSLADAGHLSIYGGLSATTLDNDATSGSLRFGNNNSQIYDDGNMHIHSRASGQSMWINTNNGSIILGNQSPVSGGSAASAIVMGSSTSVNAYVNMYGSKTYTIGSYGYVAAGGAGGPLGGTTAPYTLYCDNRIQCAELDATSDERLKDIQGEIPLQEAIDLVNNVKPIKFTWKDGEDKGLKTGFSAQQTHKAGFDHLVGAIKNEKVKEEIDEDGFVSPDKVQLTIAYDQVIPYHTAVIKHLLEKIEKLEQTVAELQAKNK